MITIKIEGLDKLQRAVGEASKKLREEIKRAIGKSILVVEREAKTRTPVRTGRMRASYVRDLHPMKAFLYPTVFYAKYVHEGTKSYIIKPRFKLALFWPGAKHPVKLVHHPGIKARKFLEKAVLASIEKIKSIFLEAVKKVI